MIFYEHIEGNVLKKRLFIAAIVFSLGIFAYDRLMESSGEAPKDVTEVKAAALIPQVTASKAPASTEKRAEAEVLLDRGLKALEAGDTGGAEATFASLMKRYPSHPAGARAAVEVAAIHKKAGDLGGAREALSKALAALPEGQERQKVVSELDVLNGELVFSKKPGAGSITYVVKSGDSLYKIGRRYKTTSDLIKRINYLPSDRINVGDRLKVLQGPFDVVIEKGKYRLTVYLNGIYVKEYAIGIGELNSTPEGEYSVENKLVDPVWNPPGPEYAASKAPDNPLGTRWIGFRGEYGIHGTIEPETIGTQSSRGCVRMLNPDVEEVYDLLVEGSKVVVKP